MTEKKYTPASPAELSDRSVAAAGVEGAVAGHGADLLSGWELIQKIRQYRAVTCVAGCELHRPDVPGGRVHRKMNLAILASAVGPVLTRKPFAVTHKLDAGAVDQQVQRALLRGGMGSEPRSSFV